MKLSWNWLQTFLTFPTSPPTPEEVEKKLTLHTAELEEIIPLKPYFDRIFAGKLLNWTQHPKAKKLHIGTFDLGPQRKKQIIFGSVHKVKKGSIYPIAINGAKLASGIEIKETEIKGEKSEGMICDNNELGFKNEELLTFSEKTIGKSLPEICIEFQDTLFDIDNKSLTHRPDLMGHHGFAREIAAIFGGKLKECPRISLPHKGEPVPVIIKSDKCRRFCALKISKIKITPSCLATQVRLENLGIRSISNVVDTTNRILLEFGQPMHAFDAEKILLPLIIRQAKKGEKLLALDGEEYELTPQDTVVADKKGVLSVAGIMGGSFSGVTENTKEIIFECANWDPVAIRKTSKRLGLRSESSMRYEKSLDSLSCRPALLAASEKLLELCPEAKIETNLTDEFPYPPTQKSIILDPNLVRSRSGIDILDEEIIQKLESIGFLVTKKNKNLNINIPSFRATKDIEIPEDLIEEVVRLHGFEDIKSKLPNLPLCPPCRNILRELEWQIKEFASSRGFLETYNYSFVNNKEGNFTGQEDSVEIENPLSKEQNQLRQTLIYNLVKNLESDLRTHKEVNFFEFGKIFQPKEILHFALLSARISKEENNLFFHLKSELSALFSHLRLTPEYTPSSNPKKYFHPSKSAEIIINEENIGNIAVLHPANLPVKNSAVVFAEINVEKLLEHFRRVDIKYLKISPFPSVHRDMSIVLDSKALMSEVEAVSFNSSPLLRSIKLFDEFSDNKKLGKNLKNLAFHLEFRSDNKTLEEKEIDENFNAIVQALNKKFKAKLRLKFDQEKGR